MRKFLPTPPFPPTNIQCKDFWSSTFCKVGSSFSNSSSEESCDMIRNANEKDAYNFLNKVKYYISSKGDRIIGNDIESTFVSRLMMQLLQITFLSP